MSTDEWKEKLSPEQYAVLREKATEAPFENAYWDHHENGVYRCAGCNAVLFRSDHKFDSGTGWPSFDRAAGVVEFVADNTHGMKRTEVVCAQCGGHLGHLFDDGPTETNMRYCVNSCALSFTKDA